MTAPAVRRFAPSSRPSPLEEFLKTVAIFAIGIATLVASAVAFVITCSVTVFNMGDGDINLLGNDGRNLSGVELGTGVFLGLIVAVAIAAGSIILSVRVFSPESPHRKDDR